MPKTDLVRWQFLQLSKSSPSHWQWRCIGRDGNVEKTSGPFPDYGCCVYDAVSNGFKPKYEDWAVVTPFGISHFSAGSRQKPVFKKPAAKHSAVIPMHKHG